MKILLLGASGQLGSELVVEFAKTPHQLIAFTRQDLDCMQTERVKTHLASINPDLIVNAAAYTAVDKAEQEPQLAYAVNHYFVTHLAQYCGQTNTPLIHFSTDYVFDGRKTAPYDEHDVPNPQSIYAHSKLLGEQAIAQHVTRFIILRISWIFGLTGKNFVKTILHLARTRDELNIVCDQWGRPTGASDVARVVRELVGLIQPPDFNHWGLYHYSSLGVTNWYDFAKTIVTQAGCDATRLTPISSEQYPTAAARPKNSVLNTQKIETQLGICPRPWLTDLSSLIEQLHAHLEKQP